MAKAVWRAAPALFSNMVLANVASSGGRRLTRIVMARDIENAG